MSSLHHIIAWVMENGAHFLGIRAQVDLHLGANL